MRYSESDKLTAKDTLKRFFDNKGVMYAIIRSESKSGSSRNVSFIGMPNGEDHFRYLSYHMAVLMGVKFQSTWHHDMVRVKGNVSEKVNDILAQLGCKVTNYKGTL